KHIVVQGGTFLNDAVLRAFEQEIGRDVVRPNISGLMGAYGAALFAKKHARDQSSILTQEQLQTFTHKVQAVTCRGCSNNCRLTINTFNDGRRFIGGNRCEKPLNNYTQAERYSLYDYKWNLLETYCPQAGFRGKIGIPMGLNMFELLPFWHTFFTRLGFEVVTSPVSNRKLYLKGQATIPSDTVCFPAKLMHGHVQALLDEGIDTIFYPCMSYNLDEQMGDNHYNCPVVAYYPEVIGANVTQMQRVRYINDYVGLHRRKDFPSHMHKILCKYFVDIGLRDVKEASDAAYAEYGAYMAKIRAKGEEYLALAKEKNMPVIVLSGRPYHLDPEVNHGIDTLICDLGAVVVSEDSISHLAEKFPVKVLNQWTYHSRLYAAAKLVGEWNDPKINLVQLVSFGCGVDAITTDEVRRILEEKERIYTQIKIDEITNLGAVKIRLRSLFAALGLGKEAAQ
ncbi:MAG TPA: 2-hydroxyglutaryl-CoA dehydratase, partial [Ruminococcaceae bacterium]|nr:2-hydroxyglutaryl-CoA dehydratase [Oscillospiraceae bacterium]